MYITMSGLEHNVAPIEIRERLSFTRSQTAEIDKIIRSFPGISGCVLISTCNRTELYLSSPEEQNAGELLCRAAGAEYAPYRQAFTHRSGDDALRHLMEVAAGLRSRIWGEDQIISQVKSAIAIAREARTADPILETMFRSAISAGKEARTDFRLTSVPTSAAGMAVALLREKLGDLKGKRALVIGNGEMGRLAASLLQKAGCQVSVTLRTYRHGQTIIPPGCGVVPYEDRFQYMEHADLLISATTSPHYTVTKEQFSAIQCPPATLVDLAIPRDIQPELGSLPGVCLYNIDDLGSENRTVPQEVTEILNAGMENFYRWLNYKDCIPALHSLEEAVVARLLAGADLEGADSPREIAEIAVQKTVELLVSGFAGQINSEHLARCESKIRLHTSPRRGAHEASL